MNDKTWIDKLLEKLNSNPSESERGKAKLIDLLKEDVVRLQKLTRQLEVEQKHLPYEHLRMEVQEMAEQKRRSIQSLQEIIQKLGGDGTVPELKEEIFPRGHFKDVVSNEVELYTTLSDHANIAEDEGFSWIGEALRRIRDENYESIEKIERIIMRINAEV